MTLTKKEFGILYNYNYACSNNSNYESELLVGTATSVERDSYIEMSVSAQNDKVVRQTEEYFTNYPNKVKRCSMICILNTLSDTSGYTSRIGIFDDHNDKTTGNDTGGTGYFFALIDNIFYIGIRTGDTDNGTDILTSQANFNYNTLPNLDLTQIHTFEIEYNNKGNANFYINTNNELQLIHSYEQVDDLNPEIMRLNLPIRYEIIKTGIQGNAGEMRQYNTALQLIDKFSNNQKDRDIETFTNNIYHETKTIILNDILTLGYISVKKDIYEPIFSIRLNPLYPRRLIQHIIAHLYYKHELRSIALGIIKNPTFTQTPTWDPVPNSIIQYSTNSKDIDNNNLSFLHIQYFNNNLDSNNYKLDLNITSNIQGEPNIYTFICRSVGSQKSDIAIGIDWQE